MFQSINKVCIKTLRSNYNVLLPINLQGKLNICTLIYKSINAKNTESFPSQISDLLNLRQNLQSTTLEQANPATFSKSQTKLFILLTLILFARYETLYHSISGITLQ